VPPLKEVARLLENVEDKLSNISQVNPPFPPPSPPEWNKSIPELTNHPLNLLFFFFSTDFFGKLGERKRRERERKTGRGVRKQRPALSFLLNIKK